MRFLFRKKIVISFILVLFSYFTLRCRKYAVKYSGVISKASAIQLWEFVSDFSNQKRLNPTILNFIIESESGNYSHWRYSVYYTEHLSQLPSLTSFAWADFEVKILSKSTYAIFSKHKTCFWSSYACVHTNSSFIVESTTEGSKYTEQITYECPVIFSSFCEREVLHQRTMIEHNLRNIFK